MSMNQLTIEEFNQFSSENSGQIICLQNIKTTEIYLATIEDLFVDEENGFEVLTIQTISNNPVIMNIQIDGMSQNNVSFAHEEDNLTNKFAVLFINN